MDYRLWLAKFMGFHCYLVSMFYLIYYLCCFYNGTVACNYYFTLCVRRQH